MSREVTKFCCIFVLLIKLDTMKKSLIFILLLAVMAACGGVAKNAAQEEARELTVEQEGIEMLAILDSVQGSCIVRNNGTTASYTQRGVSDLYDLVTQQSEVLRGAHVADKIIGLGAAALMIEGGVQRASTHVITTPALRLLRDAGVEVYAEEEIPYIVNRKKTGQCPLDSRLQGIESAAAAMPIIEQFIADLESGKDIM